MNAVHRLVAIRASCWMAAPVMPRPGPMLSACASPDDDLLKANIDCRFCGLEDTEDTDDDDDDDDAAGRAASRPGLGILPTLWVASTTLLTALLAVACVLLTLSQIAATAPAHVCTPVWRAFRSVTTGAAALDMLVATSLDVVATVATAAVDIAYTGR